MQTVLYGNTEGKTLLVDPSRLFIIAREREREIYEVSDRYKTTDKIIFICKYSSMFSIVSEREIV
jgi:hypothetical protein